MFVWAVDTVVVGGVRFWFPQSRRVKATGEPVYMARCVLIYIYTTQDVRLRLINGFSCPPDNFILYGRPSDPSRLLLWEIVLTEC